MSLAFIVLYRDNTNLKSMQKHAPQSGGHAFAMDPMI